jgi:hypothetical protein
MAASAGPRRARRSLMINSGADRAHYFPQDRSSSMAAVQISPNDEECTASAHLEYLRRGGVTTETARAASMPNTTAPMIGPCRPQCRDRHHLGSLGCPMTQSNTSEIEPTVDIIFALKAGWRRRSRAEITGRSVNLPARHSQPLAREHHSSRPAPVRLISCGWNRILYQ